MTTNIGTPKTLLEAINNALNEIVDENNEQLDMIIRYHIDDFMRQKLAAAYIKAGRDEKCLTILRTLKEELCK